MTASRRPGAAALLLLASSAFAFSALALLARRVTAQGGHDHLARHHAANLSDAIAESGLLVKNGMHMSDRA